MATNSRPVRWTWTWGADLCLPRQLAGQHHRAVRRGHLRPLHRQHSHTVSKDYFGFAGHKLGTGRKGTNTGYLNLAFAQEVMPKVTPQAQRWASPALPATSRTRACPTTWITAWAVRMTSAAACRWRCRGGREQEGLLRPRQQVARDRHPDQNPNSQRAPGSALEELNMKW